VPANFGETPFYEVRCIAGRGVEAPVLRLLALERFSKRLHR
jgi:hypothetical protein